MRGEVLLTPVRQDEAVPIDAIDSPYSSIPSLRDLIYKRGLTTKNGAPHLVMPPPAVVSGGR
jgi:hypothetical protein